ncbi:MAG: hypothetical protein IJ634_03030 [Bacteroidales bacterium]|nr:hypothetical protein [Bacteroidales bacterium]
MKKILSLAAAVVAVFVLASCDSKLCYCYEGGYESEVYTNTDTPCASLGSGERGCVESYERMDPGQVALYPTL